MTMTEHRVLLGLILLVVFLLERGICEESYILVFNEGLESCSDFNNKIFKGDDMGLGKADDEGDSMYLEGHVEMCEPIKEGTFLDIQISKVTELGSEPMWGCSLDVCKSVEDEDALWAEAMKSMNITGCPIDIGKYYTDKFCVDTSFAKDFLNFEFVASYDVVIKLLDDKKNTISCHVTEVAIKEVDERASIF